jgi:hypothetical protein
MKTMKKLAGLGAVLALGVSPAFALAGAPDNQGTAHKPTTTPPANQGTAHKDATPAPNAGLPTKAKAYGKYCQGQSKKHVKGTKGTPFSNCVTAMAKVANDKATAKAACRTLSKKHVKGTPGTPFSACVKGAAQLKKDQGEGEATTGS